MVNNNNNNVDDDDGGGGKLPPIPTYCEQPSQAEASLGQMFDTDAARETVTLMLTKSTIVGRPATRSRPRTLRG